MNAVEMPSCAQYRSPLEGLRRMAAHPKLTDLCLSQQEKCAQYWPTTEELQMSFTDTGFVVRLLAEEDQSHYTIRVLELQNTKVN